MTKNNLAFCWMGNAFVVSYLLLLKSSLHYCVFARVWMSLELAFSNVVIALTIHWCLRRGKRSSKTPASTSLSHTPFRENSLTSNGKSHWIVGLQIYRFGFDLTCKSLNKTFFEKFSNWNKIIWDQLPYFSVYSATFKTKQLGWETRGAVIQGM